MSKKLIRKEEPGEAGDLRRGQTEIEEDFPRFGCLKDGTRRASICTSLRGRKRFQGRRLMV